MFEKDTSYKILPLGKILPDPNQPRKVFDQTELISLAQSIKEVGLLSPITVQRQENGYRLVAGERRWRAASLAGLTEIPCVVRNFDDGERQLAALIENLQRRDLDPFEEATGLKELIDSTGMTQEQIAHKIGKSQSCIANKLRLLQLSPLLQTQLRNAGLTERHARALLPLPEEKRGTALSHIIAHQMTVERAEEYISSLISAKKKPNRKIYIKDIRLFINTIDKSLRLLSSQGVQAQSDKTEDEHYIYYSIAIPKRR